MGQAGNRGGERRDGVTADGLALAAGLAGAVRALYAKAAPLLLERYLITAIGKPLVAILSVCAALFASYGAADLMSDAAAGLLASGLIARMLVLRVLIALEVLIPVALYLSIVLAFGALYESSEFMAIWALRVTPRMVLRAVLVPAGLCALIVSGLSLGVRPWAYQNLHRLAYRSTLSLNTDALRGGTFYVTHHGDRVVHLESRASGRGPAQHVFVMKKLGDGAYLRVVSARIGYAFREQAAGPSHGDVIVRLQHTHVYDIALKPGLSDRIMTSGSDTEDATERATQTPALNAAATPTGSLMGSARPEDVSELQWRLSTGLSTLLLAVLGMTLARGAPRQQRRYARLGIALGAYFAYYLAITAIRTWVQHGLIGRWPGVWAAPALLALVVAFLFPRVLLGRRWIR